ncbi:uncharacterized protein LOC132272531 [Cornus florida]|uniref:uncharacterized protein LOC132272531 n=1 Tax=Cornus florida TaxID=4283 RepID=UPI00289DDD1D|nr:uncharacterized protein LOC132272531 [Cornus florida]
MSTVSIPSPSDTYSPNSTSSTCRPLALPHLGSGPHCQINPTVRQMHWILTATDFFSKWVEAIPLRHATGIAVTAFIRENIICQFGIPAIILSDNGTPFVNYRVAQLLQQYNITQRRSSTYYPKGNGQAEATNKSLLKIISHTVAEHKSNWVDQLPLALWAHRTSKKRATGQTPFSLLYGTEAILPIEIAIPAAALAARSEVGDLVLKAAKHIMHNTSAPKFNPKWEGPYVFIEVQPSGYCRLQGDERKAEPINSSWLKLYHS